MLKRQTEGSVVCPSCRNLVGVRDERCWNCGRWNPGLWGYGPVLRRLGNDFGFVTLVIWGSTALYGVMLLTSGRQVRMDGLFSFLAPDGRVMFLFGASGAVPVFGLHRWWTVLSASWLHGGLLHLLFNMLWVRQLAPATADLYGAGRTVIIYTVAGVVGFTLSSVAGFVMPPLPIIGGGRWTLGASAAIFGLLGAVVFYGRRSGSGLIKREAWGYALPMFLFGLMMPGVDNYAHAGGFLGGYLAGALLDPLKPERLDHLLAALACIVLALASIALSVLTGLPLLVGGG